MSKANLGALAILVLLIGLAGYVGTRPSTEVVYPKVVKVTGATPTSAYWGYPCRTFEEFLWAARNIDQIQPANCRAWAEANYSMSRVAQMYQEYFSRLYALFGLGWYAENAGRTELNWLTKRHPGGES